MLKFALFLLILCINFSKTFIPGFRYCPRYNCTLLPTSTTTTTTTTAVTTTAGKCTYNINYNSDTIKVFMYTILFV